MKKLSLCAIALLSMIGLTVFGLLRHPDSQLKIALSFLPTNSSLAAIKVDGISISCQHLKIPLEGDGSIEIETVRAQYDFWESIKSRQLQLIDCDVDRLIIKPPSKTKPQARTQSPSHQRPSQAPAVPQSPDLKIPPLSIRNLQLTGALILEDQFDSQFCLEAKNFGPDLVSEVNLTALTEFAAQQMSPIDTVETNLEGRLKITKNGQIQIKNINLYGRSKDLRARIKVQNSPDAENRMQWNAALHYAVDTAEEFKWGGKAVSIENAKLSLTGSAQLGLDISINQAELQLMTAPYGKIEIQSLQSIHYPEFTDINGELCSIRIPDLALSVCKQWLPSGHSLESNTASSQFILSKQEDQYVLRSEKAIDWHAIKLIGPDGPMTTWADSLKMSPEVYFNPPESLNVIIPDLTIRQKSKPLLKSHIEAKGQLSQLAAANFEAQFSVMPDGIADDSTLKDLNISGTLQYSPIDEWPLQLTTQLIPHNQANTQDSLQLRIQSKLAPLERLPIKINTFIGQQPTPSSEFQLNAELNLQHKPLQVNAQIDSPGSQLSDLKRWIEYFIPVPLAQISSPSTSHIHSQAATKVPSSRSAAWGAVDAQITAHLQNLEINPKQVVSNLHFASTISPQSLDIQECTVQIEDASIEATMRSDYSASTKPHYHNQLNVQLQNIQAQNFIPNQQKWKIDGIVEGALSINGQADDYMTAWKNSLGHLSLRSQNGRLELLELSRRKSLGIAGAEILGFGLSAILEQPDIHSKTQAGIAMVPYFKQIEYQLIELECVRQTLEIIDIAKLQLLGPDLRIQGFGAIGAQPIQHIFQQPLLCELSFASKGPIIESLKILDLIESTPDADNFFTWKPRFEISGNLEELNTDSFSDFFQQEALNLLRSPAPTVQPKKPALDLEDGIDMIEKLFSL
jgi:hypothetical protein